MNTVENQVIFNAIIVAALQWLKNAKWFPWLSAETAKLNRVIAILASGAAAIGVHSTFVGGVLTITGLSWAVIGPGLYNWLQSFVFQQLIFKATISNPMLETKVQSVVTDSGAVKDIVLTKSLDVSKVTGINDDKK